MAELRRLVIVALTSVAVGVYLVAVLPMLWMFFQYQLPRQVDATSYLMNANLSGPDRQEVISALSSRLDSAEFVQLLNDILAADDMSIVLTVANSALERGDCGLLGPINSQIQKQMRFFVDHPNGQWVTKLKGSNTIKYEKSYFDHYSELVARRIDMLRNRCRTLQ